MKKLIILSILVSFILPPVFASAEEVVYPDAPVWEEYVPEKYINPRNDFKRGNSIAELVVGIALTDLLVTAPIGIPMIVHSSTKLNNIKYSKKKLMFNEGLSEAQSISDPIKRKEFYDNLIYNCHFSEKVHKKRLKELGKIK